LDEIGWLVWHPPLLLKTKRKNMLFILIVKRRKTLNDEKDTASEKLREF